MLKTLMLLAGLLAFLRIPATALSFGDRTRQREAVAQTLGLCRRQMQQMQPILLEAASQLRELQTSNLAPQQKQQRRVQVVQSAVQQVAPLLTTEQRAQISELLKVVSDGL